MRIDGRDSGEKMLVDGKQALLNDSIRLEEELASLPVRNEEEGDGDPVAEDGGSFEGEVY